MEEGLNEWIEEPVALRAPLLFQLLWFTEGFRANSLEILNKVLLIEYLYNTC